MAERTYAVAYAPGNAHTGWRQLDPMTWPDFLAWLDLPNPATRKHCGGFVAGVVDGERKTKETVVSRSMLTLDADSPGPDFRKRVRGLGIAHVVYSTYGHLLREGKYDGSARYRLIVPLSRDVTPDEYWRLANAVMRRLGGEHFDRGSAEHERLMYRPSAHNDGVLYEHWTEGPC